MPHFAIGHPELFAGIPFFKDYCNLFVLYGQVYVYITIGKEKKTLQQRLFVIEIRYQFCHL